MIPRRLGGVVALAVGLALLLPTLAAARGYSASWSALIAKGPDEVRPVLDSFAAAHGFKRYKFPNGELAHRYVPDDKRLGISIIWEDTSPGTRVSVAPNGPGVTGNAARQKVIDELHAALQGQFGEQLKVE